jgi:hypothetical protein
VVSAAQSALSHPLQGKSALFSADNPCVASVGQPDGYGGSSSAFTDSGRFCAGCLKGLTMGLIALVIAVFTTFFSLLDVLIQSA